MVCLAGGLCVTTGAAAMPIENRVFGGCPTGYFRGFLDGQAAYVEGSPASSTQRVCAPPVVNRAHRPSGRAECRRDDSDLHPVRPAIADWLRVAAVGKSRHRVELLAGERVLIRWESFYGVDCVGNIYLSADRTLVAIEMSYDRRELDELQPPHGVQVFKLPAPIDNPRTR